MISVRLRWVLALPALLASHSLAACGDDGDAKVQECKPDDASTCADGLVCEQVGTTKHSCLAPVSVSGRVYDALDGTALAGATVVGLDSNSAVRTRVVLSGADGHYTLPVSVARKDDGSPATDAIVLHVAALDHQPFATAPRSALPIDLSTAQASGSTYAVSNAATDVALLPLPAAQRGGATVQGKVSAGSPAGVLVLALANGHVVASAISDVDGAFTIFNVTPGTVELQGYRSGLVVQPASLQLAAAGQTGVVLSTTTGPLATVHGSINIVDAPGGSSTSVILAVASTFDPKAVRGDAPAGLRVGNVSGAFNITGVPPGRYAVLAAYENDGLVRDPDQAIAGTDIVFVDVPAAGGDVNLPQSFKVTGALAVASPGANGVDVVQPGSTSLSFSDDSSEDGYELRVYDGFGSLVHENTALPRVSGGATVQYTLDTSGFTRGMLYQFRAVSYREAKSARTYISATEDLKGVFQIAR
jgi:hypothetical protein